MKQLYVFLITAFCSITVWAQVESQIGFHQKGQALHVTIVIHNPQPDLFTFRLTSKAQLQAVQGTIVVDLNQAKEFSVHGQSTVSLVYDLAFEPTQFYFLTDSDLWYPTLLNSNQLTVYKVSGKFDPGISLITSATGHPQDGLALAIGPFHQYSTTDGRIHTYLRNPDPTLAQTLNSHLSSYMQKFESEIGLYPYDQFSIVESFDEIGVDFSKMSWIGSKLLRFPFILKTSLPHELLHTWWGTGVFVDYDKGNWCEGLTTFGADYALLNETEKKVYRLSALTNYQNYSNKPGEISLSQFVSRGEDRGLKAIGYDKSMMVFVMLEQNMGPALFAKVQSIFYQRFKFKKASWDNFFAIADEVTGNSYQLFKLFWIESTGALSLDSLTATKQNSSTLLWNFNLSELLKIPSIEIKTEVQLQNQTSQPLTLTVSPTGQSFTKNNFNFTSEPISFVVDPDFLIFRNLNYAERPATFSKLFGSSDAQLYTTDATLMSDLKTVFPDIHWTMNLGAVDFTQPQDLVMTFDSISQNPQILQALQKKNIQWNAPHLTIEKQHFDLQDQAAFISLKIDQARIYLIQLNPKMTNTRWLQRWNRYGNQSYLVLNTNSASLQGIWFNPRYQNPK